MRNKAHIFMDIIFWTLQFESTEHSWSDYRGFETHCCHTVISLGKIWTWLEPNNAYRQEVSNV